MAETLSKRLRDYCNIIDQLGHPPLASLLDQAATELEALRKRCEAVEARVAMAMHVLDKIDAGLGGETDDVRDALDPDGAIAAAQEPSHG